MCPFVPGYIVMSLCPDWGGGNGEEATPVPIPNTVVKLLCADGTARANFVGE